jgi:hypothetical protein
MNNRHPGITMHKIHVEGAAGLLYVAGTMAIFLMAMPQIAPLALASLLGGMALAAGLYRTRTSGSSSLTGGAVLFAVGFAAFLATSDGALRALAVTAVVSGALFAEVLLRRPVQHPSSILAR